MSIPWSHWDLEVIDGHMYVGGCSLERLATTYGTPLFVLDEHRLRNNCRALGDSLTRHYPRAGSFFSVKTNLDADVLRIASEEGMGAEVISQQEYELARAVGIPAGRVLFNGMVQPVDSMRRLFADGVLMVHVDAETDVSRLNSAAAEVERRVDVGIRVHTKRGWGSNPFGIPPERCVDMFERILETEFLTPVGLLVHSSARATGPEDYSAKARLLLDICVRVKERTGRAVRFIDIGGGYGTASVRAFGRVEHLANLLIGVKSRPPDPGRFVPLRETVRIISSQIVDFCTARGLEPPILHLEPGTAVVEDAQLLITTVHKLKQIGGQQIAVVDASRVGMAQPLRGEYHEVFVANRMDGSTRRVYRVVGRSCSTHDWLFSRKRLPKLRPGDLLAIMDVGAYFNSTSNSFSFPSPPAVVVKDGAARLARAAGEPWWTERPSIPGSG